MTADSNDPINRLIEANRRYAEGFTGSGLSHIPSKELAVVTCMDVRIDPLAVTGLRVGEAHVIRNAGAVVTDDVVRSLVLSQRALGTRAVAVIGHTRCGVEGLDDREFLNELEAETGHRPAWVPCGFGEIFDSVATSVDVLHRNPYLRPDSRIAGLVFDVDTGQLHPVNERG